jgi:hypothetical protein
MVRVACYLWTKSSTAVPLLDNNNASNIARTHEDISPPSHFSLRISALHITTPNNVHTLHSDKFIVAFGQEPVHAIQGCQADVMQGRRDLGFGDADVRMDDDEKKQMPAMLDWTKDMCL